MKKKLYHIYKAEIIVSRKAGLKEKETFSFLVRDTYIDMVVAQLQKQIALYNEFCFDEYKIVKYDEETAIFEKVGELWL